MCIRDRANIKKRIECRREVFRVVQIPKVCLEAKFIAVNSGHALAELCGSSWDERSRGPCLERRKGILEGRGPSRIGEIGSMLLELGNAWSYRTV